MGATVPEPGHCGDVVAILPAADEHVARPRVAALPHPQHVGAADLASQAQFGHGAALPLPGSLLGHSFRPR